MSYTTIGTIASLRSKRFRSMGLSAGLNYFSLFERTKLGISVALTPIFTPPKSGAKNASNGRKIYGNACYAGYTIVGFAVQTEDPAWERGCLQCT